MTTARRPICRCPYDRKQPRVDGTVAACARCGQELSVAARDKFRRDGRIKMPWLGNDRR